MFKDTTEEIPWNWKHSIFLWVAVFLSITGVSFLALLTRNKDIIGFVAIGPLQGCLVVVMDLLLTIGFALCLTDFHTFLKVEGFKRVNLKWIGIALAASVITPLIGGAVFYLQSMVWVPPMEIMSQPPAPPKAWTDVASYFLTFGLFGGICEEICFRGFIQRGFEKTFSRRNPLVPILIANVLFVINHIAYQTLIIFLLGYPMFQLKIFLFLPFMIETIPFGYLYYRSGHNILVPMTFHCFHNVFARALWGFISIVFSMM